MEKSAQKLVYIFLTYLAMALSLGSTATAAKCYTIKVPKEVRHACEASAHRYPIHEKLEGYLCQIQQMTGQTPVVLNNYRDNSCNKAVGGISRSNHRKLIDGKAIAVDIHIPNIDMSQTLGLHKFMIKNFRGGIGYYCYRGGFHIDLVGPDYVKKIAQCRSNPNIYQAALGNKTGGPTSIYASTYTPGYNGFSGLGGGSNTGSGGSVTTASSSGGGSIFSSVFEALNSAATSLVKAAPALMPVMAAINQQKQQAAAAQQALDQQNAFMMQQQAQQLALAAQAKAQSEQNLATAINQSNNNTGVVQSRAIVVVGSSSSTAYETNRSTAGTAASSVGGVNTAMADRFTAAGK